ncbi:hypothetical protein [Streptomyces marianii]|uniref:Uncharacterized protein n=1 Tax=Streptomyces marianii TaxID=1817406 RepID=A0A5R9EBC3_9ACTN|nr:hypothetical protein [Streptomyces marianii]TLQ45283.1 hypothetical protein FEF34_21670 [Streptomyces marianii]
MRSSRAEGSQTARLVSDSRALGIGGVIWADQSLRAAVTAMCRACRPLCVDGPAAMEAEIAPLDAVFDLTRH